MCIKVRLGAMMAEAFAYMKVVCDQALELDAASHVVALGKLQAQVAD